MNIILTFDKFCALQIQSHYDSTLENINSILHNICSALEDATCATFVVSGFGLDRWPVDIGTDFCILLEQLPLAIKAAKKGFFFEIDFYEQGIERTIFFHPEGTIYRAATLSWVGDGMTHEIIMGSEVLEMLLKIYNDFLAYLQQVAPSLASHPWVIEFFDLRE